MSTVTYYAHPAWRMQANGRKCPYCGRGLGKRRDRNSPPSRDHIVPTSRGGTDHFLNIEYTCLLCNNQKGSLTAEEFKQVKAGEASRLDKVTPERRKAYPRREWQFLTCGLVLYPVRKTDPCRNIKESNMGSTQVICPKE